jgi:hypothetical protein
VGLDSFIISKHEFLCNEPSHYGWVLVESSYSWDSASAHLDNYFIQ